MNVSEPLLEPSVDRSPHPLRLQRPLQGNEALMSSIANFIKCVRGHKCLQTYPTSVHLLFLQDEVLLSAAADGQSFVPVFGFQLLLLLLHSSHRVEHQSFSESLRHKKRSLHKLIHQVLNSAVTDLNTG